MTPSTPEAEDDFDPIRSAGLAADADVADLATDPLEAVLVAEGDEAGLSDELDGDLDVDLDADVLDAALDDDGLEDDDEDLDDDEELEDDDEELEDADADVDEDLATAPAGASDDDADAEGLALDAAFEDDDEDLAAVVVGDDDDDEDVDGIRDGEFVCRSCFLAKRDTQLADPERMLCRDCA